jgi:hypothetical protein
MVEQQLPHAAQPMPGNPDASAHVARISRSVSDLSQRKDGALLGQPDGLLRALDLLAFPERNFPSPIKGPAQRTGSAQDDWAAPRDPLTGY